MPIPAVRLLEEAERLERSGEVEDSVRAMALALQAAELYIAAQEEHQEHLALEVQVCWQRILVEAAILADMWVEEEMVEEDLQEVTPLDLPVPTKTEFHLLKYLPISIGPTQTGLIIQQSGQLGNSTLTVS